MSPETGVLLLKKPHRFRENNKDYKLTLEVWSDRHLRQKQSTPTRTTSSPAILPNGSNHRRSELITPMKKTTTRAGSLFETSPVWIALATIFRKAVSNLRRRVLSTLHDLAVMSAVLRELRSYPDHC